VRLTWKGDRWYQLCTVRGSLHWVLTHLQPHPSVSPECRKTKAIYDYIAFQGNFAYELNTSVPTENPLLIPHFLIPTGLA
jgi:hypothetical protein